MTTAEPASADRIRAYLAGLTPLARSSLLTEIERMQLYDEDVSGAALILEQLRAEFRKGGETNHRIGTPSRHFFKPIEALFVDCPPERANAGQISRGSLSPIWEWISHELLPAMARDYCEAMKPALVAGHPQQVNQIAAGFQSKVVKSLQGVLASEEGLKSAQSGLGKYTCSRASINDLKKIAAALQVREAIAAFSQGLPPKIDDFEGEPLTKVLALVDAVSAKHPEALPFALAIVMKRLSRPWQIVLLALRASHSRVAEHLAATRYALGVTMVLDHLDDRRRALKQALKHARIEPAKEILTDIYDIEYHLHDWIARLDQSDWEARLHDFMAALAQDLLAEYQALPGEGDIHGDLHHVLEGIERRHPTAGLLHSLWWKGRDALAGGASYCQRLVGLDHREAS